MTRTVMVVDDNTLMRLMVARILKGVGYGVVEATDGLDALDKLDCTEVVTVITDFRMPLMDGVDFIRELQRLPDCLQMPVIIMTADIDNCRKMCGDTVCVDNWLAKPFMSHELIDVVGKTIR